MKIIVHRGTPTTFTYNGTRMSMGKAYSAYRQGATFVANGKVLSIDKDYTSHFGAPAVEKSPMAHFTYGRFQPGHTGHKQMINAMLEGMDPKDVYVFTSETNNKKNRRKAPCKAGETSVKKCENPLDTERKIEILRAQNSKVPRQNILSKQSPYGAAYSLLDRYEKITFFIGSDRVESFEDMATKIKDVIIKGVDRPMGTDGEPTKISASKVRKAIVNVEDLSYDDENYRIVSEGLGPIHPILLNVVITEIQAAYGLQIKQATRKRKRSRI